MEEEAKRNGKGDPRREREGAGRGRRRQMEACVERRVEGRENERGRQEGDRREGRGNRRWKTGRMERTKRAKASWDHSKSVWGRAEKWFWLMRS